MSEERKYEKVPTSELLDFVSKDIPYEDDKNRDKQQDYRDEIEKREPFGPIRRRINHLEKERKDMQSAIELFLYHKHDENGNVLVPASKTRELCRFR